MKIIKYNLLKDWDNPEIIQRAVSVIKRGGSLVYPTDTVYGLGVNALRLDSVEWLFKIKKRPESKPVPIMVSCIEMAKQLAFIDRRIEKALEVIWPGPTTIILEKKHIVPEILTANKRTIGLRIPDCQFTQALMKNLEGPITVTSANFSGQSSLTSAREVIKVFERAYPRPDLILDVGDLPKSQPSTILDLTGSQPKVLRVGPVSKRELLEMFKE